LYVVNKYGKVISIFNVVWFVETKNGNQINLKENKKDNNQGILKLTNYFDSKLGNVCGIVRSTYVCMYIIVLTNICHLQLMLSENLNIQGY
jgi:hypothetical protein